MHSFSVALRRVSFTAALLLAAGVLPLIHGVSRAQPTAPPTAGKDAAAAKPTIAPEAAAKAKGEAERMQQILNHRSPVSEFTDATAVQGKIPVDLTGVWLVVASTKPSPQHAPDKYQSFVQLMKVTDGATKPTFKMLDVQLPKSIQASVDQSRAQLTAWQPTPEQLAELKKTWSTLPKYTSKTLNEPIYLSVNYTLATPDNYTAAIPGAPKEMLDGTTFALYVSERYRPGEVPSGANIAQLMGRDSFYAFKADGGKPDQLNGGALLKFTVAGAGFPLPMSFGGQVRLYKLS